MSSEAKTFLEKHLPEVLQEERPVILERLYDLIDEKGFVPPNFHEYNEFGREAQKIYDDIYWNNQSE
jgi:hypothetical protein